MPGRSGSLGELGTIGLRGPALSLAIQAIAARLIRPPPISQMTRVGPSTGLVMSLGQAVTVRAKPTHTSPMTIKGKPHRPSRNGAGQWGQPRSRLGSDTPAARCNTAARSARTPCSTRSPPAGTDPGSSRKSGGS